MSKYHLGKNGILTIKDEREGGLSAVIIFIDKLSTVILIASIICLIFVYMFFYFDYSENSTIIESIGNEFEQITASHSSATVKENFENQLSLLDYAFEDAVERGMQKYNAFIDYSKRIREEIR